MSIFTSLGTLTLAVGAALAAASSDEARTNVFAHLRDAGDSYRFVIIADPQLSGRDNPGKVARDAERTLIQAVEEVNRMDPRPEFVVFLGDLVNTWNEPSVSNFERIARELDPFIVLVHGNHDTKAPFGPFLAFQEKLNGLDKAFYSFDAGPWHYVVLPCNLPGRNSIEQRIEEEMLAWLEADLAAHADRPTIVLEHLHQMPQGLTQAEFYSFPLTLRQRLMDAITRHGNVKYVFCGHIHNGILTSQKLLWEYEGIRFITTPTIIASRPYGAAEEYGAFRDGLDRAGYYLVVDVAGEDVALSGRMAGVDAVHEYRPDYTAFTDDIEPRWFKRQGEFDANERLRNGSFEHGLAGWLRPYRYSPDADPGFVVRTTPEVAVSGERSVYVHTREMGQNWANDEYNEVYQMVEAPGNGAPVLSASYLIPERPTSGGGYIRLMGFEDEAFRCLMFFHWGEDQAKANYIVRAMVYHVEGRQGSWAWFQNLGREKRGMFWKLEAEPGVWHPLQANLEALYDAAQGRHGAWDEANITKLLIGAGTWCNMAERSGSASRFDAIALEAGPEDTPSLNAGRPLEVTAATFETAFGQDLIDREAANRQRARRESAARAARRSGLPAGNLVANADFEEPAAPDAWPDHWFHSARFSDRVEGGVSGEYAGHLQDTSADPAENAGWRTLEFPVEPGGAYRVEWRWRYRNVDGFRLAARFFTPQGMMLGEEVFEASGDQDRFVHRSEVVTVPPDARRMDVRIHFVGEGTGEAWIDDIVVAPAE